MTYERFEDLPVWREAIKLAQGVYDLCRAERRRLSFSLRDQLERAALSVSNNIAEGFERGTTQELLTFIYIARGSAGEVRSMLCFLEQRPELPELRTELGRLKGLAESCSRQLRAWADSLQNTEIKGHRYLNQRERQAAEDNRRAEEMKKRLLRLLPPGNPMRKRAEEEGII